jgi:hypothetical protein
LTVLGASKAAWGLAKRAPAWVLGCFYNNAERQFFTACLGACFCVLMASLGPSFSAPIFVMTAGVWTFAALAAYLTDRESRR